MEKISVAFCINGYGFTAMCHLCIYGIGASSALEIANHFYETGFCTLEESERNVFSLDFRDKEVLRSHSVLSVINVADNKPLENGGAEAFHSAIINYVVEKITPKSHKTPA